MEGYFFSASSGSRLQPKGEGSGSAQIPAVAAGWRQGQGWYSILLGGNRAPPAQVFSQSDLSLRLPGDRAGRPLSAEERSLLPLLWGCRGKAASSPQIECSFPV